MTNHAGNTVEDVLFTPWGDVLTATGTGGYSFAKMPYDDLKTNTDLTTARVFGPNFGRWFTPDPIGKKAVKLDDPQTWNMYPYVRNNPTTLTDPTGLSACGSKVADKDCRVMVVITDRTKDKNGNYNDQFKNVKNQAGYNAIASVTVTNLKSGEVVNKGDFLARTVPSDEGRFPTAAAGGYSATLTEHNGQLALRLQPTGHIPIENDVNPAHPERDYASGILVHISGLDNYTGMTRAGGGVSEGCQLVCRSQYSDFLGAVGATADPPQRTFGVIIGTTPNMKPGVEEEDDIQPW
jgi:RHS repeat-associated protein